MKWTQTTLGAIGIFSKGAGISKEDLSESGNLAVRYGELYTKHHFKIVKAYSFISDDIIPLTKQINYGDILFAGSGETSAEIGKSAAYLLNKKCYAGGDIIIFTPKNANSLFLAYYLNIGKARAELSKLGQGQSVVHIYKSSLENLKINLPPLAEQNRIVAVLETWDRAVEVLGEKIRIKREIKKGLMQKLLSGKVRLKGFEEEWRKVNAGTIFKNKSIKNNGNEELLSATQDGGMLPRNMLKGRVTMPSGSTDSFKLVEKGDFVISLRSFQGGLEYSYYRGLVSPAYTVLDKKKKINEEFYKHYFKSYDFIGHLSTAVIGIRDGKQISYDDFCVVKIPDPSLPEQTAIANILSTADREINELEKKLSLLKKHKKFLLNNLITGKIRVKDGSQASVPASLKVPTKKLAGTEACDPNNIL